MVELRDLREDELRDELGLETLSGVFGLFSFFLADKRNACTTGKVGVSLP